MSTPDQNHPDPLEEIFLRVEQESANRAKIAASEETRAKDSAREHHQQRPSSSQSAATSRSDKARRRGSISISRIGQLCSQDSEPSNHSIPTSPKHNSFYNKQNASNDSFASAESQFDGGDIEHDSVTQMRTIVPKQSISKAVSSLMPLRRLSRAQSANVIRATPDGAIGFAVKSISETKTETVVDGSSLLSQQSTTTEIIAAGGRRRMTVSGIVGPTAAPNTATLAPSSSTGTVRSTASSTSSHSQEKSKSKSNFKDFKAFGFSQKFRRRNKHDAPEPET